MNFTQDELRILIELVSKVTISPAQPNAAALAIITVGLLTKLQEELKKQEVPTPLEAPNEN
jgi:hypothetical protein